MVASITFRFAIKLLAVRLGCRWCLVAQRIGTSFGVATKHTRQMERIEVLAALQAPPDSGGSTMQPSACLAAAALQWKFLVDNAAPLSAYQKRVYAPEARLYLLAWGPFLDHTAAMLQLFEPRLEPVAAEDAVVAASALLLLDPAIVRRHWAAICGAAERLGRTFPGMLADAQPRDEPAPTRLPALRPRAPSAANETAAASSWRRCCSAAGAARQSSSQWSRGTQHCSRMRHGRLRS